MKDYEDTIAFLGQWGRFQAIVFFLLCASIVPNGMMTFSSVFLADIPSHHCLIPDVNLTQDWLSVIIPKEVVNGHEELSRCSRYRLDVVRNLSDRGLVPGRDINVTELEQEECLDGWSYSKDIYQSTIVSKFDLVCSDQWKQPFTSTVFLLGVLFGSFVSGQIADRFGRKPVIFATMAFQAIATIVQMFSNSWTMFCILFFITGLGRVSSYVSAFVLGTEILTGKVRIMFSALGVCVSFAVGYMLLPLFAYFLRDWQSLLFGISLPCMAYLPLWWVIPESPRWLLSQGRVAEAEAVVKKAARINKINMPHVVFESYSHHVDEKKTDSTKRHNIIHLLKTSNIRNITLIVCLLWFTLRTGYYGLSLNTSQLHADPYISAFMSATIEIPAYICIWLALRYLKRQLTIIFFLFLGAMSLLLIQLVPESLSWMAVALEMVGKFAVTAGSNFMYVYVAELYPTVLRNTATGACSILSRAGSTTAPFLFQLTVYFKFLPYIILGTLSVVSSLTVFFLPETFQVPLPQTIEEMTATKRMNCLFRKQNKSPGVVAETQL
ncbi:organic cation/carnitine transporter 2-like [Takifugu flavidus]|uniref:organic cation/carnitine transporter 2-like n=1 Tax=Takifugu flavidus TaxID=433684 RepID=UPI00254443DE|nr:organic cation/carnitine transporter 2-like [Takifugu flavidus]